MVGGGLPGTWCSAAPTCILMFAIAFKLGGLNELHRCRSSALCRSPACGAHHRRGGRSVIFDTQSIRKGARNPLVAVGEVFSSALYFWITPERGPERTAGLHDAHPVGRAHRAVRRPGGHRGGHTEGEDQRDPRVAIAAALMPCAPPDTACHRQWALPGSALPVLHQRRVHQRERLLRSSGCCASLGHLRDQVQERRVRWIV